MKRNSYFFNQFLNKENFNINERNNNKENDDALVIQYLNNNKSSDNSDNINDDNNINDINDINKTFYNIED